MCVCECVCRDLNVCVCVSPSPPRSHWTRVKRAERKATESGSGTLPPVGTASHMPSSLLAGSSELGSGGMGGTSSGSLHSKASRFRRFSGLLGLTVRAVAKSMGLSASVSTGGGEGVTEKAITDTPRLVQFALEEKVWETVCVRLGVCVCACLCVSLFFACLCLCGHCVRGRVCVCACVTVPVTGVTVPVTGVTVPVPVRAVQGGVVRVQGGPAVLWPVGAGPQHEGCRGIL